MITGSAAGRVCGSFSGGFVWPVSCTRPVGASLLTIQLVGWKTREAIFHARQEGNPDNSTPPRVDGFGHPPYVRLGDRQQAGSYGMWDLSGPGVLAACRVENSRSDFPRGAGRQPGDSTPPRVDGFGHPRYVRLGDRQPAGSYSMWDRRALGFCQIQKRRADQLAFFFAM